jgi:hypothetical protein
MRTVLANLGANFARGSSLFDSRSYCEPTHSAWESLSGRPRGVCLVDTHLFIQVLRPSGIGKLEPLFFPARPAIGVGL